VHFDEFFLCHGSHLSGSLGRVGANPARRVTGSFALRGGAPSGAAVRRGAVGRASRCRMDPAAARAGLSGESGKERSFPTSGGVQMGILGRWVPTGHQLGVETRQFACDRLRIASSSWRAGSFAACQKRPGRLDCSRQSGVLRGRAIAVVSTAVSEAQGDNRLSHREGGVYQPLAFDGSELRERSWPGMPGCRRCSGARSARGDEASPPNVRPSGAAPLSGSAHSDGSTRSSRSTCFR
jgi:hypothetical protein